MDAAKIYNSAWFPPKQWYVVSNSSCYDSFVESCHLRFLFLVHVDRRTAIRLFVFHSLGASTFYGCEGTSHREDWPPRFQLECDKHHRKPLLTNFLWFLLTIMEMRKQRQYKVFKTFFWSLWSWLTDFPYNSDDFQNFWLEKKFFSVWGKLLVMKKRKMLSVVFKNNFRQNFWLQSCLLTICLVFLKFPLPTEKPHFLTVLIVWRQSSKKLAIKDSQVKHLHLNFPIVAIGHFVFFLQFPECSNASFCVEKFCYF